MSLLLPDYSSSSEDEETPHVTTKQSTTSPSHVLPSNAPSAASAAPSQAAGTNKQTKKRTKKKKTKTTLYLPPEIQRLLESGAVGDSDDDDDHDGGTALHSDSLLAKQKRVVAKRPRVEASSQPPKATGATTTTLSYLPAPKHALQERKQLPPTATAAATATTQTETETETALPEPMMAVHTEAPVEAYAAYDGVTQAQYYGDRQQQQQQQQQYDAYQYAQYYQQQQHQADGAYYNPQSDQDLPEPSTSKRARHRDRELERLLQTGQFSAVADKIVEVHAPAPHAWQAPSSDELKQQSDASELKLKASFYNTETGTTVASVKPSRLQRQKHQLNQLAFDAKAKEHELLDRKGAGLKTKRETHAKYGW